VEIDEADIRILAALQRDARLSFRELARLAGVSTPTASAKVKALEAKGVLRGYHADLSPEALGEQVFVLDVRARPGDLAVVAEGVAALPQVRACYVAGTSRVFAVATLLDPSSQAEFLGEVSGVAHVQSADVLPRVRTLKELPAAIVDRGVALAVRCEFCGRMAKGDVQRLKVAGVTHYVCCKSCKAGLAARLKKLSALAGAATQGSHVPMADP
jgi:Lrp/AsnC family leucine-responsive transcriptional regulator